ncbi:hypothetical protein INS49_000297 [Diaporthe citri]|uniref:uncharacterized protein n=1 Tax=Diaporthe citri TaxID=83186 RepID=UPI001C802BEF|nr:uncharacterized protein INS49_000297 [Diaporthe citri]KAG6366121.1 hypothetical protein INS49_000297 [Diaporthe citri]
MRPIFSTSEPPPERTAAPVEQPDRKTETAWTVLAALKEFLQQEAIKHAESAHDLTRASQRDPIIIDRFRTFAAEEVAVSGASQESLICPWGSLGSRLHIRLHCPSLLGYSKGYADSVLHQFHGSTDNAVAPSIALLASKGMIGDLQTLVSEASYRAEPTHNRANRNGRARFPEDYGPNLRAIHQAFAEWIWDSSQAGVVLLFGCENERRFLERFSQAVLFRIPGFEVVTGRGYLILDEYSNVSRIVICASHPEHTIRFATYVQAMQQDHLLNLAAALSDIPSEVRSAWCTQVKQACLMRLCDHANQLSTVQDILAILQWEARGGVVSLDMCPPNVHDLMEHSHGGEGSISGAQQGFGARDMEPAKLVVVQDGAIHNMEVIVGPTTLWQLQEHSHSDVEWKGVHVKGTTGTRGYA